MEYCKKCVIPQTAETNRFDDQGICSVCRQIEVKDGLDWVKREKNLKEVIKKYKNQNDYDCIVPFSGGKDSTFTLWYLVKILGLKVLAVRYDHNFLRNTLNHNVEKTLTKLSVDFISYKSNFKLIRKIMKESLIRRGDFCWHCHVGICAFPINTACEKNIPLLFYGEPSSEYSSYYDYNDNEELNVEKFNIISNLGIQAEDMMEMLKERYPNEVFDDRDFKPFFFPSQRELNKKKIKALYLGSYIPWDVKKQVEIIKRELDWRGESVEGVPPEYDYEKIECALQGSRDYTKYLKRGFGRTSHLTSIDIRNKKKTREEAIELVKKFDGKKPKSLELLLQILNISEDEYNEIVKKHLIYPNTISTKKENENRNIFHEEFEDLKNKFRD